MSFRFSEHFHFNDLIGMKEEYIQDVEGYLALRFEAYFHQDWEYMNMCPCEVMRYMALETDKDGVLGLIDSLRALASFWQKNGLVRDALKRISLNSTPENYGMRPRDFLEDLIDLLKYIGINEVSVTCEAFVKERGTPLSPLGVIDKEAVSDFPYIYEIINECFSTDVIKDKNIGYAEYLGSYFSSQEESKVHEIDKELRALYYKYGNAEALRITLVEFLGLRYNLDYYSLPSRTFLAVVIEVLYNYLNEDRKEPFSR